MADEKGVAPPPRRVLGSNVVRVGVPRAFWTDLYHTLLERSWLRMLGFVAGVYLVANSVFAVGYLLGGDCIENVRRGSFLDLFFFSIQTMATIGYGKMAPVTTYANALVSFEAFVGTLFVAMVTGLVFAKFSRPTARVLFSRNVVVGTRDGKPTLMLRLANERGNQIVEATIHVTIMKTQRTKEGERVRRLFDLELVRDRNAVFALSWSVMHVIDERSPLFGETAASLEACSAQLIASIVGLDETFAQTVSARHIYIASEIVFGARFVDVMQPQPDGTAVIDYRVFHDTAPHPLGDEAPPAA